MKSSTWLLLGAAGMLLYKNYRANVNFLGVKPLYIGYSAHNVQLDEEDGGDAVLYPVKQPEEIAAVIDSNNYYEGLAGRLGLNTDLSKITDWIIEGDYVRWSDADGTGHLMSYAEFKHVLMSNIRQIASASGDWSNMVGE